MAMYIDYVDGTTRMFHVGEGKLINDRNPLELLSDIAYIQADGDELVYIHSMGYHDTGKTVQVFVKDAKDIVANW